MYIIHWNILFIFIYYIRSDWKYIMESTFENTIEKSQHTSLYRSSLRSAFCVYKYIHDDINKDSYKCIYAIGVVWWWENWQLKSDLDLFNNIFNGCSKENHNFCLYIYVCKRV